MADSFELVLPAFKENPEWEKVRAVGKGILKYISENQASFDDLNQPEKASHGIEKELEGLLSGFGFEHEPKKGYADIALRPDYINQKLRTIVEIERGKTIQNNMDMLDFWKTHIHPVCRFLVLIVPKTLRHSLGGNPEFPFEKVKKRLGKMFDQNTGTNVWGLVLIGY